jgi:uncharacterized membrane protein
MENPTSPGWRKRPPVAVRFVQGVEQSHGPDKGGRALQPVADTLLGSSARKDFLQGRWLGHAIHPVLTDLPLGMWMSASVLDLVGGEQSQRGADLLLGVGIATALPTAVTGVAEWGETSGAVKRVGVVHATLNSAALALYVASLVSRRRGRRGTGVVLAMGGGLAASLGGFLGGHLTEVRKVSSRHPAFEDNEPPEATAPEGTDAQPHLRPVDPAVG